MSGEEVDVVGPLAHGRGEQRPHSPLLPERTGRIDGKGELLVSSARATSTSDDSKSPEVGEMVVERAQWETNQPPSLER
jgi:hypothetical protein